MAKQKPPKQRHIWFERIMALTATINLALVFFDLSYITWRDFYFRNLPQITQLYDRVKGIEAHRETLAYLDAVDRLNAQVNKTGLKSQEVALLSAQMERLSNQMIDSNPFTAANKSGTLEKIKNRIRDRTNQESAKLAFATFWSPEYLTQNGWTEEFTFFNQNIRPLIASNYYRRIGESGEFIDYFFIIDLPFILIFAVELSLRSFAIKRRHAGFSWIDAVLWRWYDLFLILPFWRWLRIIPVVVRLDQAQLVKLSHVRQQVQRGIVANFAEELTEIVVVRVINQIQGSIQRGELINALVQKQNLRPYMDINNVNEVEAIASIFVKTTVYQVLPKIQPELIAILRHNIESTLKQSPVSRNLLVIPGVGQMQTQLSDQIATQIATNLYNAIVAAVEDPVAAKLSGQLVERFADALGSEVQKKHVVRELQNLLTDFLEEVKLNYVQRMSDEDIEQIIEQTRQLKNQTSVPTVVSKQFQSGIGSGE